MRIFRRNGNNDFRKALAESTWWMRSKNNNQLASILNERLMCMSENGAISQPVICSALEPLIELLVYSKTYCDAHQLVIALMPSSEITRTRGRFDFMVEKRPLESNQPFFRKINIALIAFELAALERR